VQKLEVEAVYEDGTLKLTRPLPLAEGQKVLLTLQVTGGAVERLYGLIPWRGDLDELDRWLNDPDEGQWGNRDL
jgi:predicted DNA-binding antitoxin AbrB/MazE fold protein